MCKIIILSFYSFYHKEASNKSSLLLSCSNKCRLSSINMLSDYCSSGSIYQLTCCKKKQQQLKTVEIMLVLICRERGTHTQGHITIQVNRTLFATTVFQPKLSGRRQTKTTLVIVTETERVANRTVKLHCHFREDIITVVLL